MALTMEGLKGLVEGKELKYFLDPDRDALMLGATGVNGSYQLLILLELEGTFIQFRTMNYHSCPVGHEHLDATLQVLGDLNFRLRFVKFGWDPSDGEVAVYGDAWIEDGDLTQNQFGRMVDAYLTMRDLSYARIDKVIKTGVDPGELEKPEGGGGSGSGLPPELQAMIDRLTSQLGGGGDEEDDDEEDEEDSIGSI